MIAITASTGKLGQSIIAELESKELAGRVRLIARNPEKLERLSGKGFQLAKADYDDAESLEKAFVGIDTVLLISGNAPNNVRTIQHKTAIDAAVNSGVRHIVYTSFVNPSRASKFVWAIPHEETEAYLKASGLIYTFLRNNQYASNLDQLLLGAKESGVFAIPGAHGKVAYVTHRDVAGAIVGVLTGSGYENQAYQLTGAEALDGLQIAEVLSGVLGRPIRAIDAPIEDFAAGFRAAGFPEFVVDGLLSVYAASGAGEYEAITADVQMLAGHPAESLRSYIARLVRP